MPHLLKRFACGRCGATGPIASDVPYLQCDSCGAVGDYDWGIARAHKDWPAHEALLYRLLADQKDDLAQAVTDANRRGWSALYAEVLRQVIAQFPALYPRRVGEPAYLAQLVELHTAWQMTRAIEPELLDGDLRLAQLRWAVQIDAQKRCDAQTLWPFIDATLAQLTAQDRICTSLPPGPPDDFGTAFVRRIGIAATVAEWLPRLTPAEQRALVERLGVAHEYVEATDAVKCHTCGAMVALVNGAVALTCPYCNAEMHEARAGLAAVEGNQVDYTQHDEYLEAARAAAHDPLQRLLVLEGDVPREGTTFHMITVRAVFAPDADAASEPTHQEIIWFVRAAADDLQFGETRAWLEMCARDRKLAVQPLRYREHPRVLSDPYKLDDAELDSRLHDVAPGASASAVEVVVYRHGFVYEITVGDEVARLSFDGGADGIDTVRAWRCRER